MEIIMTKNSNSSYSSSVTDSVIKVNEIVLGSAASTAMAAMYISMANAPGVGSPKYGFHSASPQHSGNGNTRRWNRKPFVERA